MRRPSLILVLGSLTQLTLLLVPALSNELIYVGSWLAPLLQIGNSLVAVTASAADLAIGYFLVQLQEPAAPPTRRRAIVFGAGGAIIARSLAVAVGIGLLIVGYLGDWSYLATVDDYELSVVLLNSFLVSIDPLCSGWLSGGVFGAVGGLIAFLRRIANPVEARESGKL